ncbi:hypothetical protein ACFL2H_12565, partial [Planctomycetota bacterium]
ISISSRTTTVMEILKTLAARFQMDVGVSDDSVVITTPDRAMGFLWVRIYEVTDLVKRSARFGHVTHDHDSLIDIIVATISPNSWDDVGGEGSIQGFSANNRAILVVSQTYENHELLDSVLNAKRRSLGLAIPKSKNSNRIAENAIAKKANVRRHVRAHAIPPQIHE